jgi:peptidoglycan/LPS O-acetylase OafA/YrhL
MPQVNLQLWTLPFEMWCYATIAAIVLVSAHRSVARLLAIVLLVQVVEVALRLRGHTIYGTVSGLHLILAFLYGVVIYRLRKHLPYDPRLFVLSLVAAMVFLSFRSTMPLAMAPAAYTTVYLGLLNPPRNAILASGDYSYGMYLYGFPVQQAVAAALPWTVRAPAVHFAVSMTLVAALAWASWRWVEAPFSIFARPKLFRFEARLWPLLANLTEKGRRAASPDPGAGRAGQGEAI